MIDTKRIGSLTAMAAILALSGCTKAPELPYGTVQLMMANEVQPTSEIFWNAVRFQSELIDGEVVDTEFKPETEEDWQKIEAATVHLAELGEALKTPAYSDGRGEDWQVFAQGLVDVAGRANEAAKSHDPDAVFEVGSLVYNVCSACHQAYPAETPAAGETAEDPITNVAN